MDAEGRAKVRVFEQWRTGRGISPPEFEPSGQPLVLLHLRFADGVPEAFPLSLDATEELAEDLRRQVQTARAQQN